MTAPTPRAQRMAEFDFRRAYAAVRANRRIRDRAYARQAEFPDAERVAAEAEERIVDLQLAMAAEIVRLTGLSFNQLSEVI